MDIKVLLIIPVVIIFVVLLAILYIFKAADKSTKKSAQFYQDIAGRFGLEELSGGRRSGEKNLKLLKGNLKILWNKKILEEIEIKPELEGLTQEDALSLTSEAQDLFLAKSHRGFLYDIQDARDGNLRLFTAEKDSDEYLSFTYSQAIVSLMKTVARLREFPYIEFPEETDLSAIQNIESFVIASSGINLENDDLRNIAEILDEKFGELWKYYYVSEDALKFEKVDPETVEEVVEEVPVSSPFLEQKEAKRIAKEEAERAAAEAEAVRLARWKKAEAEKKARAARELQKAIEDGRISEKAANPGNFLLQSVKEAAQFAGLTSLKKDIEIVRSDNIGIPTSFVVYSNELLSSNDERFHNFVKTLRKSLNENLGSGWKCTIESKEFHSISFLKSV